MAVVKIGGVKQITTDDSRYYEVAGCYRPSVTHILHRCWPDNFGLVKWIGSVGNEEAERIRDEAGAVGTFVHEQIPKILNGGEESASGVEEFNEEQITKAAWSIESFKRFVDDYKYEEVHSEFPVAGDGYAGTADGLGSIMYNGYRTGLLADWKTSKSLREEMRAQLVLYNDGCMVNEDSTLGSVVDADLQAIIHLGNKTKKGYTFSLVKQEKYSIYMSKALACVEMFHVFWPDPTQKDMEKEGVE